MDKNNNILTSEQLCEKVSKNKMFCDIMNKIVDRIEGDFNFDKEQR